MSFCIICRLTHSGRVCSAHLDAQEKRIEGKTMRLAGWLKTGSFLAEEVTRVVQIPSVILKKALFCFIHEYHHPPHFRPPISTIPPSHPWHPGVRKVRSQLDLEGLIKSETAPWIKLIHFEPCKICKCAPKIASPAGRDCFEWTRFGHPPPHSFQKILPFKHRCGAWIKLSWFIPLAITPLVVPAPTHQHSDLGGSSDLGPYVSLITPCVNPTM